MPVRVADIAAIPVIVNSGTSVNLTPIHSWTIDRCNRSPKGVRLSRKPAKPFSDNRKVGYARVSTREQNLDLQLDALRAYGVREDNLWYDVISGARSKRPELQNAFMDARPGDEFVVWKLDRLGRNSDDLLSWVLGFQKKGIKFVSLTEVVEVNSSNGRFALRMMAAMSEFERDRVIERTMAGVQAAKDRGKQVAPTLKMTDGVIEQVKQMLRDGKSVAQAADALEVSRQSIYVKVGSRAIRALRAEARAARRETEQSEQ